MKTFYYYSNDHNDIGIVTDYYFVNFVVFDCVKVNYSSLIDAFKKLGFVLIENE